MLRSGFFPDPGIFPPPPVLLFYVPFTAKQKDAYSHRKKQTARIVQSAVTPTITQIGNRILSVLIPKNVFFIIVSPCVSGKTLTIFCIAIGMTSMGSVVPEKTSMGK